MYAGKSAAGGKNPWTLFLLLLAGLVLGAFVGEYLAKIPYLSALAYGKDFGFDTPVILDLSAVKLQFALLLRVNLGSVIGVIAAIIIYKRT
jgi:hypothetical protein